MLILVLSENFLRFHLQEMHNASYISKMSWSGKYLSDGKVNENI